MSEDKKEVKKKAPAKKAAKKEAPAGVMVISRHRGDVILPCGKLIKPDSVATISEADVAFLKMAKVKYKVVKES